MTRTYGTLTVTKDGGQPTEVTVRHAEYALRDYDGDDIRPKYAKVTALTDGSVTKVGSSTVGSEGGPIYWKDGKPALCDTAFVRTSGDYTVGGNMTFSKPVKVAEPTGSGQAVPTNGEGMVASKFYLQVGTVTASDTDDLSVTFSKSIGTVVSVTLTTGTGNSAVTVPLYTCWTISGTTVTLKGMGGVTGTVKVYCI